MNPHPHVATVTVARNRPTRTADYGPAPEGHPAHGRMIGTGKARRPARLSRILRAGSTFQVDVVELAALEAWRKANPTASSDLVIRLIPVVVAVTMESKPPKAPTKASAKSRAKPDALEG